MVVEILSPSDLAGDVAEKLQWWLDHGVRLVWIVDPENQCITTHEADGSSHVYRRSETLDGGKVLPGFTLQLTDLFM